MFGYKFLQTMHFSTCRTGSGVYSCVAESEGGMTEKNATIVITDSSTYLGKVTSCDSVTL